MKKALFCVLAVLLLMGCTSELKQLAQKDPCKLVDAAPVGDLGITPELVYECTFHDPEFVIYKVQGMQNGKTITKTLSCNRDTKTFEVGYRICTNGECAYRRMDMLLLEAGKCNTAGGWIDSPADAISFEDFVFDRLYDE